VEHSVGVSNVALDQFDTDIRQRRGFVGIANQGANVVAALNRLLANVAAGLPGRPGDEDRAGYGALPARLHIEHI
jgi:hypothetical protein